MNNVIEILYKYYRALPLTTFLTFRVYLYIQYPETVLSANYYTLPFALDVWISIFIIIGLGGIASVIIENFSDEKKTFQPVSAIFTTYECLCNQGKRYLKIYTVE